MKKLMTAASIIERDAVQARLKAAGIESISPARDMSRKVTNDTTDLSLNGYSTLFDGFIIYVEDSDEAAAQRIVGELAHELEVPRNALEDAPSWRRFYFCSIFSILMPILLTVPAVYHGLRALRSGEKANPLYVALALVCLLLSSALVGLMLWSWLQ
jgi:hypothetical protein